MEATITECTSPVLDLYCLISIDHISKCIYFLDELKALRFAREVATIAFYPIDPQSVLYTPCSEHPHYLRLPKIKSKFHLDSFFPRTALQWNDLPADCFPPTYDPFKIVICLCADGIFE